MQFYKYVYDLNDLVKFFVNNELVRFDKKDAPLNERSISPRFLKVS